MVCNEIISSICICCSATIFSISLQFRKKTTMLFVQLFASILYLLSYLFVLKINQVALIGSITALFEFIRLIVFYSIEKNEKFNTKKINLCASMFFSLALTTCIIFAWCGWLSLLPLISAILVNFALGNKNIIFIKIAFIIQAVFITTYLFLLSLLINAISQIFVFIFSVVGLIIYLNQRLVEKSKENKS